MDFTTKPLTLLSERYGCAAKLDASLLQMMLEKLHFSNNMTKANIYGHEDVGVLVLPNGRFLIQSIDAIAPISDDPLTFGGIAVAHALSDIYAKGVLPLTGLLLLSVPVNEISIETGSNILQGAINKLDEAGVVLLGGHSIVNSELHLGISVTAISEKPIIANNTCKDGDILILTKPLGTGIVITELKNKHQASQNSDRNEIEEIVLTAEKSMLELNKGAMEAISQVGVSACTDITGFGLIGHICEMLSNSPFSANLNFEKIPFLSGVIELANINNTRPAYRNWMHWRDRCYFAESLSPIQQFLLCDPQTSGGLLISVEADKVGNLFEVLTMHGVSSAQVIGRVSLASITKKLINVD